MKNQNKSKSLVLYCAPDCEDQRFGGSQSVQHTWNECVVLKTKAAVLRQNCVIPMLRRARCTKSMATMLLPANPREEIQVTKV